MRAKPFHRSLRANKTRRNLLARGLFGLALLAAFAPLMAPLAAVAGFDASALWCGPSAPSADAQAFILELYGDETPDENTAQRGDCPLCALYELSPAPAHTTSLANPFISARRFIEALKGAPPAGHSRSYKSARAPPRH